MTKIPIENEYRLSGFEGTEATENGFMGHQSKGKQVKVSGSSSSKRRKLALSTSIIDGNSMGSHFNA